MSTEENELHGIRAFGAWVVVTVSPGQEQRHATGLIVPAHHETPGRGIVLSVGEAVENFGQPPQPGDVVLYHHHHEIDAEHHAVEATMVYGVIST